MMRNYPAFLVKSPSQFMVFFPDFVGCIAFAATVEQAFSAAQEVLSAHLSAMSAAEVIIPEPSDLLEVQPDPTLENNVVAKMLIPVKMPGKTVRTNISIDAGLLALIDMATSNRSMFFAEAAQHELERRRRFA